MTNFEKSREILYNLVDKKALGQFYIFEGNDKEKVISFAYELSSKILGSDNLQNVSDFISIEKKDANMEKIREIIRNSHIVPYKDKKIFLFEDGENLSEKVQNALLKTLEEPSKFSLFIIIIQNSSILLDTIISRAQVINFNDEEILEKDETYNKAFSFFKFLLNEDIINLYKLSEDIKKEKEEFPLLIDNMMQITSDMINGKYIGLKNKELEKLVEKIDVISLSRTQEILEDVLEKYNKNSYFKGLADYMIFKFMEVYIDRSNWGKI